MPLSQGGGLSVIGGLSLRGGLSVGRGFSPVLGPTLNLPFSTLSADQMTTLGVTFSRPSHATLVDATGAITYAPNNLVTNSTMAGAVVGTPGTLPTSWNSTLGVLDREIVGAGTINGMPYIDVRYFGVPASTVPMTISPPTVTGSIGQTYINSMYVALIGGDLTNIQSLFTLRAGAEGGGTTINPTATLTRYGNVRTLTATVATNTLRWNCINTVTPVDFTLRIAAPQCELVTYQTTPSAFMPTTSAAYYGPRFTYDPVTLVAQGLLIEEARTNLCLYSQDFTNAAWTKTPTVTADQLLAPDGTLTADLVNSSGTGQGVYQTITVSASTTYTFSFYVKLGTMAVSDYKMAFYDATAASFIVSEILPTQTPTSSGWTRVTYQVTTPVGCVSMRVYPFRNGGTASGTFYLWGAQLEAGSFATSPIPTFGTALARSADSVSMTGTNFSSWFNQSEGTFVAEATWLGNGSGTTRVFQTDDGTSSNRMIGGITATSARWLIVTSNVSQADINPVSAQTPLKSAMAYKANDFSAAAGNVLGTPDTNGTVSPGQSGLRIGCDTSSTLGAIAIKSIRYYPTRLSNAQLQALSA